MLTTIDNPYNPRENYELWMQWDQANGYFTQELVARLADIEEDDDELNEEITAIVVQEILENDEENVYMLV